MPEPDPAAAGRAPPAVREARETQAARARGRDLLARMGLAERIDDTSGSLSGGQRQPWRWRALMKRPEPVPADEPAGKLDRAAAMQVMGPIARIDREEGTTFPISAQDAASAAFRRRRVLVGEARVTGRGGAAADRRPEA